MLQNSVRKMFFMIIHNSPMFTIYFGNAQDNFHINDGSKTADTRAVLALPLFTNIKKFLHVDQLIFLQQTHSADGVVVTQESVNEIQSFAQDGDYLIANIPVGIGVLTADCLPIVLHDSFHNIVAVVHAGWRGSVKGIAVKAIERMQQEFGTQLEHLKIFFGPSAGKCCYEVSSDFAHNLDEYVFAHEVLHRHHGKIFFDLPSFNRLQLQGFGVPKGAFHCEYNVCTICNETYFSYRRQGERAGRNLTVVALR